MLKTLQVLYHVGTIFFMKGSNHVLEVNTSQGAVQTSSFLGSFGVQHQQLLRSFAGQPGIIRRHRLANGKEVDFRVLIKQLSLRCNHPLQRKDVILLAGQCQIFLGDQSLLLLDLLKKFPNNKMGRCEDLAAFFLSSQPLWR